MVGRVADIGGIARTTRANGTPGRRLHRGHLVPSKHIRGHALDEDVLQHGGHERASVSEYLQRGEKKTVFVLVNI